MPLTRNGAAKVHIFLKKCKQNPEKVMLCLKIILADRLLLYVIHMILVHLLTKKRTGRVSRRSLP